MHAVRDVPALDQAEHAWARHTHDLDVLTFVERARARGLGAERTKKVCAHRLPRRLGGESRDRLPARRKVARLLAELALRAGERLLARFHHASRELETIAADPVPILPHEHHFVLAGDAHDAGPVRGFDDVKFAHLAAVGEPHAILVQRQPAPLDERSALEDLPRGERAVGHGPSDSMTTTRRAPNLDDPGFTPGAAHFEALFSELLAASREDAPHLERVLARGGEAALLAVLARLPESAPTERARLVSVLGRIGDARASEALRAALADRDERVARRAANALGKLDFDPQNDAALRAAWHAAGTPFRRSLAEALGKVGSAEARALLEAPLAPDPELERIARQALLVLERRYSRGSASKIRTDAPLGVGLLVVAECRAGLADVLAAELHAVGAARAVSPASVELSFAGALAELFVARTALRFSVRVELARTNDAALPDALATALASDAARATFGAWTEGTPRFRLSFAEGGHQRALVFRSVEALRSRCPELVNDPRGPSWEVTIARRTSAPHVLLTPIAFEDPRFAYRKRDVRAASHPTIAAAIARTAGAEPDDVVWDPFVGSALELVERARLGPYRALIGSDVEPAALEAARENLTAAGLQAELLLGNATTLAPARVSLILTNPPMGRRLVRDRTVLDLLDAFVAHAARVLVPGGRLVWLSPAADRSVNAATRAGLRVLRGPRVDLGGFEVELQTFRRTR